MVMDASNVVGNGKPIAYQKATALLPIKGQEPLADGAMLIVFHGASTMETFLLEA
jgi:hypothetical protein